eukprot:6174341-Pleurochrysis_carterae.AAC.2
MGTGACEERSTRTTAQQPAGDKRGALEGESTASAGKRRRLDATRGRVSYKSRSLYIAWLLCRLAEPYAIRILVSRAEEGRQGKEKRTAKGKKSGRTREQETRQKGVEKN